MILPNLDRLSLTGAGEDDRDPGGPSSPARQRSHHQTDDELNATLTEEQRKEGIFYEDGQVKRRSTLLPPLKKPKKADAPAPAPAPAPEPEVPKTREQLASEAAVALLTANLRVKEAQEKEEAWRQRVGNEPPAGVFKEMAKQLEIKLNVTRTAGCRFKFRIVMERLREYYPDVIKYPASDKGQPYAEWQKSTKWKEGDITEGSEVIQIYSTGSVAFNGYTDRTRIQRAFDTIGPLLYGARETFDGKPARDPPSLTPPPVDPALQQQQDLRDAGLTPEQQQLLGGAP